MRNELSQKDYKWIMKVKNNPSKYYIEIDNDCICVINKEAYANDKPSTEVVAHTFD